MLFRKLNGQLTEINRFDFINDLEYYKKIMNLKKNKSEEKKKDYEIIDKVVKLI